MYPKQDFEAQEFGHLLELLNLSSTVEEILE